MATIVTRAGKGSPLTHNEVDANFNNLNNDKVEESTTITAGTGLTGGGDLSANRTISLADTAVAAGSYGSASAVGTFTVDAQGRLTAASNTNIAIANTAVSGLGTMSTQNANNVAITGGSINGTTVGASTASTGAFTTLSASNGATISGGNLTFSSTAQRITGDMSNATVANRLIFQTSTANNGTFINTIGNGTVADTTSSGFVAFADSNTTDSQNAGVIVFKNLEARISTGRAGSTASYLPMTFYTGGSERVRIDTSGNVGIGTGSPLAKLHINSSTNTSASFFIQNQGTNVLVLSNEASWLGSGSSNNAVLASYSTNSLLFGTNAAERMRIDSSGNVGIGRSPSAKLDVAGDVFITKGSSPLFCTGDNQVLRIGVNQTEYLRITTGGEVLVAGSTDNGAYNLQCNGTGVWGAGAYVNGSDARIKEDVNPIASGLDVIEKLNPVTYRYKESWTKDQSIQTGFIAQELLTALEGQVYVDGVVQQGGAEGYYSVAYQNIIPILTKAVQELKAENDAMKARLDALEAK